MKPHTPTHTHPRTPTHPHTHTPPHPTQTQRTRWGEMQTKIKNNNKEQEAKLTILPVLEFEIVAQNSLKRKFTAKMIFRSSILCYHC